MTKDEVLARLREERAKFNARVAAVPRAHFEEPPFGREYSPKEIVAHVTAYEELIVRRLVAARGGETTEFERDRVGWEIFNQRVWIEARKSAWPVVLEHSHEVFAQLLDEVGRLTDDELNGPAGIVAYIDPAWLQGRSLAELIGVDAFDHYAMHFDALEEAAEAG